MIKDFCDTCGIKETENKESDDHYQLTFGIKETQNKESDDHYQLTDSKNTESDIISKKYLQFLTLIVSTSITPIVCTTHSLWVALTISGVPILICLL